MTDKSVYDLLVENNFDPKECRFIIGDFNNPIFKKMTKHFGYEIHANHLKKIKHWLGIEASDGDFIFALQQIPASAIDRVYNSNPLNEYDITLFCTSPRHNYHITLETRLRPIEIHRYLKDYSGFGDDSIYFDYHDENADIFIEKRKTLDPHAGLHSLENPFENIQFSESSE
jgi:hypothetical protein